MINDGAIEAHLMFGKVFESVRARLRARADEEALMDLSDAALADIGLNRAALPGLRSRIEPAQVEAKAGETLFLSFAFPMAIQRA
ncbi:protein of unknown function [Methylorubrum extorquens]|uniref:YjiS-like domain-containing protein n=1 Tax=Methylorubrum extorquens TaxID=408 RepID=A0A2N9AM01_METEX|nr:protein of unknown function [Methylorubrum extorquens]